jgi:hypothetical protein
LQVRPSFITYYDNLDKDQLFAVQPTVLYVIALFMLDLTCELTTWVMLGQQQFGSLLTFARLEIVDWQFRASLFDTIVVAIVRAIAVGGVLWRWRTVKVTHLFFSPAFLLSFFHFSSFLSLFFLSPLSELSPFLYFSSFFLFSGLSFFLCFKEFARHHWNKKDSTKQSVSADPVHC